MDETSLADRVQILEQRVQALATLPDRMASVELQIVQLRNEMRDGFSAIRREMGALAETLRGEMGSLAETLRAEIREGDAETRRYMRVLHEEVIERIGTLQEGRKRRKRS